MGALNVTWVMLVWHTLCLYLRFDAQDCRVLFLELNAPGFCVDCVCQILVTESQRGLKIWVLLLE